MPKQQTADYFKVTCKVEPPRLGDIIAALSKLGVEDIHFDLVTDVRAYAKRTQPAVPAHDFLTEWIKDHPTFRAIEVVKLFEADGRPRGGAYPAIGRLVEAKVLKKLGPGNYGRADVKALAAPKKKNHKKYDVPNFEFLLRAARRNHGRFNNVSMAKIFEADGRPAKSISALTTNLIKKKMIKRIGDGQYELLAKAKPKPKPNGHAVPAPAEAAGELSNG